MNNDFMSVRYVFDTYKVKPGQLIKIYAIDPVNREPKPYRWGIVEEVSAGMITYQYYDKNDSFESGAGVREGYLDSDDVLATQPTDEQWESMEPVFTFTVEDVYGY
jgi:hypothetical protein